MGFGYLASTLSNDKKCYLLKQRKDQYIQNKQNYVVKVKEDGSIIF
jgi:hypothetical protein